MPLRVTCSLRYWNPVSTVKEHTESEAIMLRELSDCCALTSSLASPSHVCRSAVRRMSTTTNVNDRYSPIPGPYRHPCGKTGTLGVDRALHYQHQAMPAFRNVPHGAPHGACSLFVRSSKASVALFFHQCQSTPPAMPLMPLPTAPLPQPTPPTPAVSFASFCSSAFCASFASCSSVSVSVSVLLPCCTVP